MRDSTFAFHNAYVQMSNWMCTNVNKIVTWVVLFYLVIANQLLVSPRAKVLCLISYPILHKMFPFLCVVWRMAGISARLLLMIVAAFWVIRVYGRFFQKPNRLFTLFAMRMKHWDLHLFWCITMRFGSRDVQYQRTACVIHRVVIHPALDPFDTSHHKPPAASTSRVLGRI